MPAKGRYCPQCGSDQYDHGRHVRGPRMSHHAFCPSCDATIYEGDNEEPRSYKIRGCTHCGVMLDEKGL
jgi:transposase-like protein